MQVPGLNGELRAGKRSEQPENEPGGTTDYSPRRSGDNHCDRGDRKHDTCARYKPDNGPDQRAAASRVHQVIHARLLFYRKRPRPAISIAASSTPWRTPK